MSDQDKLLDKVKNVIIEKVSPALNMHGGDLEVVGFEKRKDGYDLKVVLKGACDGCGAAPITLQYLVQETIDEHFPDDNIDIIPIIDETNSVDAYL